MNVRREGAVIVGGWIEETGGDPQLDRPASRTRFLAWVREDEARRYRWNAFRDLYLATDEEAIHIAAERLAEGGLGVRG